MNNIEDLLREALSTTPAPAPTVDPFSGLDRRIRRARRWLAAGAGIGVAVVTAAVVVPLATLGATGSGSVKPAHSSVPTPSASQKPAAVPGTVTTWPVQNAQSVTVTTDGSVWTAVAGTASTPRWYVLRQTADGRVVHRYTFTTPIQTVMGHESTVWAWGGGDGGYPDGSIYAISLGGGPVAVHHFVGSGVRGIAVSDGQVWATVSPANSVDQLEANGDRLDVVRSIPLTSQPEEIVATSDGQMWIREDLRKKIVHLVLGSGSPHLGQEFSWSGGLFDSADHDSIWTKDCKCRVVEINPAMMAAGSVSASYGDRIQTPGDPRLVVEDGAGGMYVATSRSGQKGSRAGVAYYANAAAAAAHQPRAPTAFYPFSGYISAMAPGLDGGVIIVSGDERVWKPNAG